MDTHRVPASKISRTTDVRSLDERFEHKSSSRNSYRDIQHINFRLADGVNGQFIEFSMALELVKEMSSAAIRTSDYCQGKLKHPEKNKQQTAPNLVLATFSDTWDQCGHVEKSVWFTNLKMISSSICFSR